MLQQLASRVEKRSAKMTSGRRTQAAVLGEAASFRHESHKGHCLREAADGNDW